MPQSATTIHRLALTPQGRLLTEAAEAAGDAEAARTFEVEAALRDAFAESSARGLIALASRPAGAAWPAELVFWREFANAYLAARAHLPETGAGETAGELAMPPELGFELALRIPAMRGAEYASPEIFAALWHELGSLAREEARAVGGWRQWLAQVNPALHQIGRVTFHLAENKRSPV